MRVLVPEKTVEVHIASTESMLQLWHERLGHQESKEFYRVKALRSLLIMNSVKVVF